MNPFGVSITDETLKAMSRYYGKTITQEDRAREAKRLIHAEDKNLNALNHVLELKSGFGSGASTLCLVYNATGDTLELAEKMDWFGQIYMDEPPRSFKNGQWIALLHTCDPMMGSVAGRVYRGKNINADVRDFFFGWNTLWGELQNRAYTEVREKDHFPQWSEYLQALVRRARKITKDESDEHCTSTVSIGGITSPEYIAMLQHKFRPLASSTQSK